MNKFVVVGNDALAQQIRAGGYETLSLPSNTDFGMLLVNMGSLGQFDQIVLVCTAEHSDLASSALPYVQKVVLVGAEPTSIDDGIVRIASVDASQVLALTQSPATVPQTPTQQPAAAVQPTPTPTPVQQPTPTPTPTSVQQPNIPQTPATPPTTQPSAAISGIGTSDAVSTPAQQGSTVVPEKSSPSLETFQPLVSPQEIEQRKSDPLPHSALHKAQYEDLTYDPAFKGAPWASQVTDQTTPHGLIIGIAAAKGGAGKSTLTCWLAEALTASGVTTALIDANIGQPDIAKMTGTWGQSSGIAALTGEQRFSDDELFDGSQHVDGLGRVLGGPAKPLEEAPEGMLASMALATERLAAHHEFVLVDTPVGTVYEPVFGKFVLHVANVLLIVTNPHQPTVHDTVLWVHDITKPLEDGGFGWPRDKMIGVLNRANPETELDLDIVKAWAPNLDIICDIPEVEGVIAAVNSGEWRCPKAAKESVAYLAQQLCQSHPSIKNPLSNLGDAKRQSGATSQKQSSLSKFFSKLRKQ